MIKVKVLSPVDRVEEVEALIKAGTDELYCGVFSEEWDKKYPAVPINRRVAKVCNFRSFGELKECLRIAHSYNVPVSLTLNEHYYTQEQYPLLSRYIGKATETGVDSLLISDLALLLSLREMKVPMRLHVSIGGTIYNSEAVKFYQSLGVSRITFPRSVTIQEVREVMRKISNIETTVFILNSRCPNEDGFCTFMHFPKRDESTTNACMLPYSVELMPSVEGKPNIDQEKSKETACLLRQQVWSRYHMDEIPCGVCALYDFEEMGVDYAKIVGRGNQTWRKVHDIKFIRLLLALLRDGSISREEYREKARRLFQYAYKRPCRTIMCYFPEVMSPLRTLA